MDFLEIRKKAQERAAARAAGAAAPSPAAPAAPALPAAGEATALLRAGLPPAAPDPVVTALDVLEGELAARLQGLPPALPQAQGEQDRRFTTWRPGSAAPPALPQPGPPRAPEPDPADFAVVAPGERRARGTDPGAAASPARAATASEAGLPEGGAGAGTDGPGAGLPERGAAARAAARSRGALDEFFYRPDEEAPTVALPGGAGAEPLPASAPAALEEFLTFRLGREEYGVPIELVREVLKAPPVTEVPRAPPHVVGVVTVRGEVVAVFDPRRRLGLAPAALLEGEGRIVLVDAGEGTYGLLVDAVAKVVRLPRGSVEPCPQGIGGATAECLAGIGREEGRIFTVLDLVALLRRAPVGRRAAEGRTHADA